MNAMNIPKTLRICVNGIKHKQYIGSFLMNRRSGRRVSGFRICARHNHYWLQILFNKSEYKSVGAPFVQQTHIGFTYICETPSTPSASTDPAGPLFVGRLATEQKFKLGNTNMRFCRPQPVCHSPNGPSDVLLRCWLRPAIVKGKRARQSHGSSLVSTAPSDRY